MIQRLPIAATLVTFIAVVIMFALGIWQLQRADEKFNRLNDIDHKVGADMLDLTQAMRLNRAALDRQVKVVGRLDTQRYFLIDNKIQQGRVGFDVLVPLNTAEGTVMLNWGWIAATNNRATLPTIQIENSEGEFRGLLAIPTSNRLITETAVMDQTWPKVMQQIDLALMAQNYTKAVLPFIILLDEEPNSGFVRKWQSVVMPPEKHIAYAIQWFLLALAAIVIFIFAQRRKSKRGNNE